MKLYYVNKKAQIDGTHEVHSQDCRYLPHVNNLIRLGYFNNGKEAVKEAKNYYYNVDGCYFCCREAHND